MLREFYITDMLHNFLETDGAQPEMTIKMHYYYREI